jgi:alpha-soluble NSF attachment protein
MTTTATTLIADAERLTRRTFLGLFAPTEDAYEAAATKYQNAGLAYKTTRSYAEAAAAFQKAADCFAACHDAVGRINAKKEQILMLLHNSQEEDAVSVLETDLLPAVYEAGKHDTLVKVVTIVAPLLESTQPDMAADLLRRGIESARAVSPTVAFRFMKQLGILLASQGKYTEAATVLEELVRDAAVSSDVTRHLYRVSPEVVLLTLANGGDIVSAEAKMAELATVDYMLSSDRKWRLAQDVLAAFRDTNVAAFVQATHDYDTISPLEPWLVSVLLHIKRQLTAESIV